MADCPSPAGVTSVSTRGSPTAIGDEVGDAAPLYRLPSRAWLIGMGNLGQAYLWTLGLLRYQEAMPIRSAGHRYACALETSTLTTAGPLEQRKTRAMAAAWAEARGFRTALIERPFAADFKIDLHESPVAVVGLDNALARQDIEWSGSNGSSRPALAATPARVAIDCTVHFWDFHLQSIAQKEVRTT